MSGTTTTHHHGSKPENNSSCSEQAQEMSKEALCNDDELQNEKSKEKCEPEREREEKPAASMTEERSVTMSM